MPVILRFSRAQGGTEYLVTMSVVLGIALICIALLFWPIDTTKDAKKQQTDIHFKIGEIGTQVADESWQPIVQGLVAYYKFDEGSGTTAADSRGGKTGNITGAGWSWVQGINGNGLDSDGSNGYINYGTDSFAKFTEPFTVSYWHYPRSPDAFKGGVSWGETFGNRSETRYSLDFTAMRIGFKVSNGSNINASYTVPSLNEWYMFTGVADADKSIKLYVNGQLVASSSFTGELIDPDNKQFTIGGRTIGLYNFNGTIDEVMIYNRALSGDEIELLYENPGYPQ